MQLDLYEQQLLHEKLPTGKGYRLLTDSNHNIRAYLNEQDKPIKPVQGLLKDLNIVYKP